MTAVSRTAIKSFLIASVIQAFISSILGWNTAIGENNFLRTEDKRMGTVAPAEENLSLSTKGEAGNEIALILTTATSIIV